MMTFPDIPAVRLAVTGFSDQLGDLPEDLRDRFVETAASPSPIDVIVGLGELIWAHRDALPAAALDLGAALIAFATERAWHGLLENGRGLAIVANLHHTLGELMAAPAPLPAYVAATAGTEPTSVGEA